MQIAMKSLLPVHFLFAFQQNDLAAPLQKINLKKVNLFKNKKRDYVSDKPAFDFLFHLLFSRQ